jgi:hypothetical protein
MPRRQLLTKWAIPIVCLAVGIVAVGGCSSTRPSAAESSACTIAAGLGKPIAPSQQESVQAHIHDYDKIIRAVETSTKAPMAAAAKEWMSALAHSNVAEVEQAAAKMCAACHDLGIQPLVS